VREVSARGRAAPPAGDARGRAPRGRARCGVRPCVRRARRDHAMGATSVLDDRRLSLVDGTLVASDFTP